jgi:hypothetical protein
MKSRHWTSSILGMAFLAAPSLTAGPIRVDFTAFPGVDNIFGTSDDVPVHLTASSSGGVQARFTNEFAFINGGVGFLVDSLCCTSPTGFGLGAITSLNGVDVLAQARPDVDSTAYRFGSLEFRLVSSTNGVTPTHVTSIDIRLSPGSSGTIDFFNPRDDLRFRATVPHDGSTNILYSDADGLTRVVFTGTGSVNLFEFDATAPLTEPPPLAASTPEPGSLGSTLLGTLMLLVSVPPIRKVTER